MSMSVVMEHLWFHLIYLAKELFFCQALCRTCNSIKTNSLSRGKRYCCKYTYILTRIQELYNFWSVSHMFFCFLSGWISIVLNTPHGPGRRALITSCC